jgi:hypothetical protein
MFGRVVQVALVLVIAMPSQARVAAIRADPIEAYYTSRSTPLWFVEGAPTPAANSLSGMRVIDGKPRKPTPLIASTIYYATLNPYWNMPRELVQSLVAARVVGPEGTDVLPTAVDCKAAAKGTSILWFANYRDRSIPWAR